MANYYYYCSCSVAVNAVRENYYLLQKYHNVAPKVC